jgi:hypothetical protein
MRASQNGGAEEFRAAAVFCAGFASRGQENFLGGSYGKVGDEGLEPPTSRV